MGWKVLYIEESDYLSTMLDNLKVRQKSEHELLVPLKDIHSLVLDNYKLVVSIQLLNKCAENNINVVLCGVDHNPVGVLVPYSGHHIMADVLKRQIEWSQNTRMIAHQLIVKEKISNQLRILEYLNLVSDTKAYLLKQYIEEVEPGDITNREGLAAKVYFRIIFGDKFQRFDDDVINAGLNYGYTIIRTQINKTIVAKGLNASLGIIHKGPANMFNLSDDIIEIFRPIVDLWVYKNLRLAESFTKEHRVSLIDLTTKKMYFQNQSQTIFNCMTLYVISIVNFFENDRSCIEFPVFGDLNEL